MGSKRLNNLKKKIKEDKEELLEMMKYERNSNKRNKIHLLYLVKTEEQIKITEISKIIKRPRTRIYKWFKLYEEEGIEGYLKKIDYNRHKSKLNGEKLEKLERILKEEGKGFSSFKEAYRYVNEVLNVKLAYISVYKILVNKLKAKLKVVRPVNENKDPEKEEAFKKKLPEIVEELKKQKHNYNKVNLLFQGESRFGLITVRRRRITARGVKPIRRHQNRYKNYYVYGTVNPFTGESFFINFSKLNSVTFQAFLNEVSLEYHDALNIIILDNAPAHTAKSIIIPDNIKLVFQPPYSPEVNPIERFWQYVKDKLAWQFFDNLQALNDFVDSILCEVSPSVISSISLFPYISNCNLRC